jgi:uncharacterized protein YeaO (DUF488 family)
MDKPQIARTDMIELFVGGEPACYAQFLDEEGRMPDARQHQIRMKRAYEKAATSDGQRILVDRRWPRGVRKEDAQVDEWLKDIAPSDELRKWFGHDPARWEEFQRRYCEELQAPERQAALGHVRALARMGNVTLVYGARDEEHNQARVLLEVLKEDS